MSTVTMLLTNVKKLIASAITTKNISTTLCTKKRVCENQYKGAVFDKMLYAHITQAKYMKIMALTIEILAIANSII